MRTNALCRDAMSSPRDRRTASGLPLYLLVALSLLVTIALLKTLGNRSLWYDEAYTYCFVTAPWHVFTSIIPKLDSGIAFYYLLMRGWSALIGRSPFELRLFSTVFALSSVAAIYWLGSLLFSHRVGLIASALLLLNSFWFQQAQTARVYSFAEFFALLSSVAYMLALREPNKARLSLYYVACMAVLSVSQFAVAAGLFLGHVISFRAIAGRAMRTREALPAALATLLIIGFVAILITFIGSTLLHTPAAVTVGSISEQISYLLGRKVAIIVLGLVAIAALLNGRRKGDSNVYALAAWTITPIALIVTLAIRDSEALGARYMIASLGPFLILTAYGLSEFPRQRSFFAIALAATLGAETIGLVGYLREPWRDFNTQVRVLSDGMREGDVVIFSPPYLAVRVDVALKYEHLALPLGTQTVPSPLSDAWQSIDQRLAEPNWKEASSRQAHRFWLFAMSTNGAGSEQCDEEARQLGRYTSAPVFTICLAAIPDSRRNQRGYNASRTTERGD